jgi:hypothetical protein
LLDARVRRPISLYKQSRTQYAYEISAQNDSSNQVQLGFALAGIEQSRDCLKKFASSKIIKARSAFCRFDQINRTNGRARDGRFIQ